jgi:hypothetical protein
MKARGFNSTHRIVKYLGYATMAFCWRLIALVTLMAVVAWIDWRRHAEQATRWREYSFLLVAAMLGGIAGVAIDQLTSTISPDYFVLGKGIPDDADFRLHVVALGFQAGLIVGMVIGGIYLIVNNPRPDRGRLSFIGLLRFGVAPLMAALTVAPVAALVCYNWDPLDLRHELRDQLSPLQINHFLVVWGVHVGLYLGGAAGTILGVVQIRRTRSAMAVRQGTQ